MTKIQFKGRVFPLALEVFHRTGAKGLWKISDVGDVAEFEITIEKSNITVDCEFGSDLTQALIEATFVRAFDLSRATVDLISFSTGNALTVLLEKLVHPTGEVTELLIENPMLAPLCTAYGLEPSRQAEFIEVYKIVLSEPAVFMAFNDLIMGISYPHYAPVNCARAIEGIRHLLAPGLEPKKQWPIMNEALRLEKSYVDVITATSTKPRHGDRTHIPGSITTEVARRAWIIMNRYLEFRKRGSVPLPQPEFPTLN